MNRTQPVALFAIATAVAVLGSLAGASSAQAYPPLPQLPRNACFVDPPGGYQFPGGAVTITYPDVGSETRFTTKTGTHVDTSAETFYPNGTSMKGRITGDITKGSLINLTVTRGSEYPPLHLGGSVLPDNTGHGEYTFENSDLAPWAMDVELNCVPVPDQPKPQPQPENKPVAGPDNKPAAKSLGTATVVADTDMYDKPDGQGQKIGTLAAGEQHPLMEPCRDDWCRVGTIELGGFPGLPNGTAWVYAKGFLTIS
jgi:hypothetical protein